MRKIFDIYFYIAQIILLISVIIEINQKEYWGAYMTFLLAAMILIYQVTAVRCDYWREECFKALFELGNYKAKAEHLEYLQKMKGAKKGTKQMSNEKFTQGNWEIEEREARIRDTHMFAFAIMTKEHRICMCQTDDDRNIPQMRANAALIAAAPDMYRFIKQLYDCGNLRRCDMEAAEKLLERTRGEE